MPNREAPADFENWLGVTEAANRSNYSINHVRYLARTQYALPQEARKIGVLKRGKQYLVYLPDLMAWKMNNER